jgi:hypothetical protein
VKQTAFFNILSRSGDFCWIDEKASAEKISDLGK